jgi:hypothetical protein
MIKKYFLPFLIFFSITISAQDTQYWAKQYGTYGELLGGLVVGGISDLSATYYNPGSMAFIKDSTLILTTHSIQAYIISLDHAFGTENKLASSSMNISQSIFAFRLRFKWFGKNQIVVSYLTRYDFNFNAQEIVVSPYAYNQKKSTANEVLVYLDLAEYWPGITWAHKISNIVGLGATLYIPYRSQEIRNQLLFQARDSLKNNSTIIFEDYSYFNFRALIKFGVSIDLKPLMLGITITTPSMNIFGTGSSGINLTSTNKDFPQENELPGFASDFQDDLFTRFKSPLSIAIGTSYYLENTSFYFTLEWFNSVADFNIMNPNSFVAQSSGNKMTYNANYSLASVTNFGFGIKHIINPDFTFYGSITSDQTAYTHNKDNNFALSNWDIIHIRSGGMFNINNFSITLGLGYGFTGSLYNGLSIFGQKGETSGTANYYQLDAIFGLTYNLQTN